jgi:hypothetical protein
MNKRITLVEELKVMAVLGIIVLIVGWMFNTDRPRTRDCSTIRDDYESVRCFEEQEDREYRKNWH